MLSLWSINVNLQLLTGVDCVVVVIVVVVALLVVTSHIIFSCVQQLLI